MQKSFLITAAVAAILMTGCSTKSATGTTSGDGVYSRDVAGIINQTNDTLQNVYFDFDKFNIRADQQSTLNTNALLFNKAEVKPLRILVEGNCDEWGSDEYNYALGVKRAKAAKDALIAQGVAADRIEIKSNGESKPVCTERSESCDAKNRRDEFRVMQ